MSEIQPKRLNVAVVGTGISGMAAAWLLSFGHRVTVFERLPRLGGHSNTVDVTTAAGALPVDTGFIVYNESTYPNLTALLAHLGVETKLSEMSFSVSLDGGRLEYSGGVDLSGLFAQRRNLIRPRFWSMLADLRRFYASAPRQACSLGRMTLGAYLARENYGAPFREDHLLPMAAAIWSAPADTMLDYPAEAFIRFFDNHGLLKLTNRPVWRTVVGGSRAYVKQLMQRLEGRIRCGNPVRAIHRDADGIGVEDGESRVERFDHVVIAAHADEALAMLEDPSADETRLLGAFGYSRNLAILHRDPALMPARRKVWASWNYIGDAAATDRLSVTYWMNRLQGLPPADDIFVTLNSSRPPRKDMIVKSESYDHPIFNAAAIEAQRLLWRLQGERRTWFCGAYFGAGFHEDGLQAGLAVAEALGGVRRPWTAQNESGRIHLPQGSSKMAQT
jgi:predicted NAD/FAD-binding protein